MNDPTECRSCHARIVGVLTVNGKWMPVDPEPREDGNLVMTVEEGSPIPRVRVLKKGDVFDGPRFVSHFVTCPQASIHRARGSATTGGRK
ncbi:MAG: hypothetical protein LC749_01585 [Actinobacteria bacterium]|nr:hypothetical protein [Actinomycetota bacterium]